MKTNRDGSLISELKSDARDELDEIAADMEGFRYDLDEARKSIAAAIARKRALRAKLSELKTAKQGD